MSQKQQETEDSITALHNNETETNIFFLQFHKLARGAGWWSNRHTHQAIQPADVFGEKIALIHSEVSEALEGFRKDKMDDHIPTRSSVEVELADAVIRIFDLAGAMGLDIVGAMVEKAQYNALRADHKVENRIKEGGKKF